MMARGGERRGREKGGLRIRNMFSLCLRGWLEVARGFKLEKSIWRSTWLIAMDRSYIILKQSC